MSGRGLFRHQPQPIWRRPTIIPPRTVNVGPLLDWTLNQQSTDNFNSVAQGNGVWVAVGNSGVLRYATDPRGPWTSNNQGSTTFNDVFYGNGTWVAVGPSGNLRYATDPTGAWTLNTQGANTWSGVAYGNGTWVVVGGASGALRYATDPTGAWTLNAQGAGSHGEVTYANGIWVAVGAAGSVYHTTDPTGAWTSNPQGSLQNNSVAYGDGTWVLVGEGGTFYYTTDPTGAWTSNTQEANDYWSVAYYGGSWVASASAITTGLIAVTTNPTGVWTSVSRPGTSQRNAVAHGDDGFWVVVGFSGTLEWERHGLTADAVIAAAPAAPADRTTPKTNITARGIWRPSNRIRPLANPQRKLNPSLLPVEVPGSFTADAIIKTTRLFTQAYAPETLASSPVAYWRFGEPSGTNANNEVGTLDGTYVNTPDLGVAGALTGDADTAITVKLAQSESVTVPDDAILHFGNGPFSFELWIKRTSLGIFAGLISAQTTSSYLLRIDDTNHLILTQSTIGNALLDAGTIADTTTWHHIVATWDNTSGGSKLYVDGADRAATFTSRTFVNSAFTWYIGAESGGGSQNFDGSIDEPAIYNVVLSAGTVAHKFALGRFGVAGSGFTADAVIAAAAVASPPMSRADITALGIWRSPRRLPPQKMRTGPLTIATTVISGAFTADSVILRTQSGSFTADSVLLRTSSSTFTADAVLKATQSLTFSADACIATVPKQVPARANLTALGLWRPAKRIAPQRSLPRPQFPAEQSGSFTADAIVRVGQSGSFTADACISTRPQQVPSRWNLPALRLWRPQPRIAPQRWLAKVPPPEERSGSFTADAIARVTFPRDSDISLAASTTPALPLDFFIATRYNGGNGNGYFAHLEWDQTNAYGFGVNHTVLRIVRTFSGDTTLASIDYGTDDFFVHWELRMEVWGDPDNTTIRARAWRPAYVSSPLENGSAPAWTTVTDNSGIPRATGNTTDGFGTVIYYITGAPTLSADAVLKRTQSGSFTADAVIKATVSGSFTADAVTKRTQTGSFTADSVIVRTTTSAFTADAVIKRTQSSVYTADAVILRTQSGSFSADAVIVGDVLRPRHNITGLGIWRARPRLVPNKRFITTPTALAATTSGSFTADAVIKATISGSFTANAAIRTATSGQLLADAVIKTTQSGSFAADAVIVTPQKTPRFNLTAIGVWRPAKRILPERQHKLNPTAFFVTQSSSFTADAMVRTIVSGSFTANAVIFKTQSGSFTADAVIKREQSGSFTADAVILATRTGSFTADSLLVRTQTGSFSSDSVLKATISGAFSADAVLLEHRAGALTADAVIVVTRSGSFTADAVIKATVSGSFTADAILFRTQTASFTADAIVRTPGTGVFTTDAVVLATQSASFTADAVISTVPQQVPSRWNLSALGIFRPAKRIAPQRWLSKVPPPAEQSGSFTADAITLRTQTGSFTADAFVAGVNTYAFTIDAAITTRPQQVPARRNITALGIWRPARRIAPQRWLAKYPFPSPQAGSFTADAEIVTPQKTPRYNITARGIWRPAKRILPHLQRKLNPTRMAAPTEGSFTADAMVRVTQSGSFTADAWILRIQTGSFTANACVLRTQSGSFTADAIVRAAGSGTFTADAVIRRTISGSFTADAWISATAAHSFTADAVIRRTQSDIFTANAVVRRTQSATVAADAVIRVGRSGSFTADAVIRKTFGGSLTADAVLLQVRPFGLTANAVFLSPRSGAFTADAVIKRAQSGSFTADATVRRTASGSFTVDAVVSAQPSFTADAVIRVTQSGSFTADADVTAAARVEGSFTADAVIAPLLGMVSTLDLDFIFSTLDDESLVSTLDYDFIFSTLDDGALVSTLDDDVLVAIPEAP